jgi:plasmid stabilization system protein ParE
VKVRFAGAAQSQFLSAIEYIKQDNPAAAYKFRKRAETALRRLIKFPESGRRIPELPDLPYREVLPPPYRFFYRVKKGTILIVSVWHEAQLIEE